MFHKRNMRGPSGAAFEFIIRWTRNNYPKGLLMVVSKRWFEFCPESNFPPPFNLKLSPFLPRFYLSFSLLLTVNLFLTSIQPLLRRESRATIWKPRFTDPWLPSTHKTSRHQLETNSVMQLLLLLTSQAHAGQVIATL